MFKLNVIRIAIVIVRANAVVSQCLTENNRFEDMRWVGAFGVYVVVFVGGFLVWLLNMQYALIYIHSNMHSICTQICNMHSICTPMAPQYANIFMAHLEKRIMEQLTQKPILYLRYIDDIFFCFRPMAKKH